MSIDSQRRELEALAKRKTYAIVKEYSDTVESAKDDQRPGFQELLRDLKSKTRSWTTLLITDTSRLSRDQFMAYAFDHECKKRGIKVTYSKLPESDPITDMVTKSVFRVFDQLHSMMSKQKGLAGMRENVHQGWRAGGRAPIGYQLEYIETGAIRDGQPVRKSHLVKSPEASKIKKYLKARAAGTPRAQTDIDLNKSSLVDLEWNALVYAGSTVWNMRYPKDQGRKRRPRDEWVINEGTHDALITMPEAETIIKKLEAGSTRRKRSYLLSGIIETPEGRAWHGNTDRGTSYYRVAGKSHRIKAQELEEAITDRVRTDVISDEFIQKLTESVSKRYLKQNNTSEIKAQIQATNDKIEALVDMSLELEHREPVLRKIDKLEAGRQQLEKEYIELEAENEAAKAAARITPAQVKKILKWNEADIASSLPSLVEKIVLNEETTHCQVVYCVKVASPRGFEPLLPP